MTDAPAEQFIIAGLTSSDLIGVVLGAVGATLVLVGAYYASILISKDPRDIENWQKLLALSLLLSGLLLSIAGLSGTLWDELTEPIPTTQAMDAVGPVPPGKSFSNLLNNGRVERMIKLVVRKPSESGTRASLGTDGDLYTLVGDFDEMKGRTAADAVTLLGGKVEDGDVVTAIVFPRNPHRITPASAQGLLQTVAAAQAGADGIKLDLSTVLTPAALQALQIGVDRPDLSTWAWKTYGKFYPDYCKLALDIRCGQTGAGSVKIEQIANWHPLGFSERAPLVKDACAADARETLCGIKDASSAWASLKPYYGGRIFYIKNEPLTSVPGRLIIEFDFPETQRIPDVTLAK